ncbi:MAG: response regulator transcription factor [Bacteroidota bacterium]|nr:response regulator transcription factor [Bacteroidota bacterium]
MKILLVEDEKSLASFIKKGLKSEGMEVDIAYDGKIGLSMFNSKLYETVIIDVNIPVINGFELCKMLKSSHSEIPVIFLTALGSIEDKTEGFDAGADDYIVKPFEFKELLIRIKAHYNKYKKHTHKGNTLKIADLVVDITSKTVFRNNKLIELTAKEFTLLEYLLKNKGKIVTRVDIAEKVWEINFDTNTNIIDVYINYLRNKVDKGFEPKLIHTMVGMGYSIRE